MSDIPTPIDILAKAVAHAKSERSSPSYVPPGGVQFVMLPAWVAEALHVQLIAAPVPPHAAGEEEKPRMTIDLPIPRTAEERYPSRAAIHAHVAALVQAERKKLLAYAQHQAHCDPIGGRPCVCGLQEIINA